MSGCPQSCSRIRRKLYILLYVYRLHRKLKVMIMRWYSTKFSVGIKTASSEWCNVSHSKQHPQFNAIGIISTETKHCLVLCMRIVLLKPKGILTCIKLRTSISIFRIRALTINIYVCNSVPAQKCIHKTDHNTSFWQYRLLSLNFNGSWAPVS